MDEHPPLTIPSGTPAEIERFYRSLRRIRRVEEEIARLYPSNVIRSPIHLSIGQEAVSVGVIDGLNPDDVVAASYRGHAAYLAKGGDLKAMFAELYGRDTGCARGRGGSMHLIDPAHHLLGTSAVVGTHIPLAAGQALALKREGRGRVVVVFFGDGATEEGVFHETLNFAALHRLPLLFVCENNFYAIHSPLDHRWATRRLCERVATYGIPAHQITDGDLLRIRACALEAVASMRQGSGPVFLECHTYRWCEHVGPSEDFEAGYRNRTEAQPWQETDPLDVMGRLLDPLTRAQIDQEITLEIAEAVAFAEASSFPAAEELLAHVYAP
jgi:pyruvate dehydrogenase E1 component alpha subunit